MTFFLFHTRRFCLYGLLCLASVNVSAQGSVLYRYSNEQGVKVISTQIPSRYVGRGYDIITFDGRLVEQVPPEPTEEEKALLLQQQQEAARIKAMDEELLSLYSHPDDIEAAKQRKLLENTNVIGNIDRNIEKINDEINSYQALAAADERGGREISDETLEAIKRLRREKEIELAEKQKMLDEAQRLVEEYNRDIKRFNVIRPQVQ